MDQVIENPDLHKDVWYNKTKEHWENAESTIKAVLGGNDQVHLIDLKASCEIIEGLILSKKMNTKRVLDCGAGIGRVTENVLINYFDECDLVEQDEKFVQHSKSALGTNHKVKNFYQSSLQDFNFSNSYNVIWIQWIVENISDDDLITFLVKCGSALENDGYIIIKENVVKKGTKFWQEDYSKIRSEAVFKKIFKSAGLKLYKHFPHPNWPSDLINVVVFILKK